MLNWGKNWKSFLVSEGWISRIKKKIHKLAEKNQQKQNKLIKIVDRSPASWARD